MPYSITGNCNGCIACTIICPVGAITGEKKQLHSINESICIDCGACGKICKYDAVLNEHKKPCKQMKKSDWAKPVFNLERCSACVSCVQACPVNCLDISIQKEKNTTAYPMLINEKSCIACGFCEEACMLDAVKGGGKIMENVTLVTGAGSGMGQLAAIKCAERGEIVAGLDLNEDGLKETAKNSNHIHTYTVDITDFNALEKVVNDIKSNLGNIDRVYNAAGIMPFGKIIEQDPAVIRKVMDVNYGGLVNITSLTVADMVKRGRGDFISFSSMVGIMPSLYGGGYCASKFAARVFTEILYQETRDTGVNVLCVCPPLVKTPLLKQGKATVWPKLLDAQPPIEPSVVIDAIDKAVKKRKFMVFPGTGTSIGALMRRLFPGLIWKYVHKLEGW